MIKSSKEGAAEIWAQTLNTIPENEWKFVLNAVHDTLPHNANCGARQKQSERQEEKEEGREARRRIKSIMCWTFVCVCH